MIRLSTEGLPGRVFAERVGVTAETVSKWRKRFEQFRVAGLTDSPRSGRPRSIDDNKVTDFINKTLQSKPKDATEPSRFFSETRWFESGRLLSLILLLIIQRFSLGRWHVADRLQ